jgi:hypothetical protein
MSFHANRKSTPLLTALDSDPARLPQSSVKTVRRALSSSAHARSTSASGTGLAAIRRGAALLPQSWDEHEVEELVRLMRKFADAFADLPAAGNSA